MLWTEPGCCLLSPQTQPVHRTYTHTHAQSVGFTCQHASRPTGTVFGNIGSPGDGVTECAYPNWALSLETLKVEQIGKQTVLTRTGRCLCEH